MHRGRAAQTRLGKHDYLMSRVSQICWTVLLVTALSAVVVLRFKQGRGKEGREEAASELANLREGLQAEQARRTEAELDRSNAVWEATQLRGKLQELEVERGQWEQATRERDAYRKQVAALEQQLSTARSVVPGTTAVPANSTARTAPSVDTSQAALPNVPHQAAPRDDAPADEKERFEAILCANHLLQIGLAGEQWSALHDDAAPPDLLSLKDYLAPLILVCPSARPRSLPMTWKDFDPAMISYQCRLGNWPNEWRWSHGSTRKFAQCPIHGTSVLTGSPPSPAIPSRYVR
jgi:hypothetical protein